MTFVFFILVFITNSSAALYHPAVLVWKCLHGAAPRYLADLCVPAHSVRGRQQLRSMASGTLLVPRARTAIGQRSFAVNGPRTWNSLPGCQPTLEHQIRLCALSSVISRHTCFSSSLRCCWLVAQHNCRTHNSANIPCLLTWNFQWM